MNPRLNYCALSCFSLTNLIRHRSESSLVMQRVFSVNFSCFAMIMNHEKHQRICRSRRTENCSNGLLSLESASFHQYICFFGIVCGHELKRKTIDLHLVSTSSDLGFFRGT
jgi:hypothetical protein